MKSVGKFSPWGKCSLISSTFLTGTQAFTGIAAGVETQQILIPFGFLWMESLIKIF